MSTSTLVKMESGLSILTISQPYTTKSKKRKSKRTMASRRLEVPYMGDSQPGSSNARVKRFHSKSRTGCLTCRQRRVKCDEQRTPNCARCERGKYKCDWQDSRPSRSRAPDSRRGSSTTRSPSLATMASDDDTTLSHRFFSEGIVNEVATLFADVAESFVGDSARASQISAEVSNFYQFVYQASHQSHVIRKTLTALCCLYERAYSSNEDSSPQNYEYITRYSEAIPDLRQSLGELSYDIILIASILVANCEYLMGDLCAAVQQLREGAKILATCNNSDDVQLSPELSDTLGPIFGAFNHDSLDLEGMTPESDYMETLSEQQFDSLNDANNDLLQIYSHTFALQRVAYKHPCHVSSASGNFQRWSNSWRTRTNGLEESLAHEELLWLQLLHGQQSALHTVLDNMTNTNGYRAQDRSQLKHLVDQVTTFFQSCSDPTSIDLSDEPFLENVGLILPLFLVAMHCGDIEVCRAALLLLGQLSVKEGIWNSCCAHAIGEFVMNARYAARLRGGQLRTTASNFPLPIGRITKATCLDGGKEVEVTVAFLLDDAGQVEQEVSSVIVGGFCAHNEQDLERLCSVLVGGGYQGPVLTQPLDNCHCHSG